ncbi:PI-PLC domain-containing protein [Kinneretia aquatilis]|jgi:hypothetical protein|uniref:hypothetical protein n=1 Tax=Kinneretia aquatilis TaxID=2070761 RepID=UPI001057437D|nr:hypothetical protein [Paucibacter aquatile]
MTYRYVSSLGEDKRISEIVFAGSHDASITSGSSNAQTQSLDIAMQAKAGVRLFDLRIAAKRHSDGSASLVGYHGSTFSDKTKTLTSKISGQTHSLETSKRIMGEYGLKLSDMLRDARRFVETTGEFLIFKFDKCSNYKLIAEYCINILEDNIFKASDGQEFAKLQLSDLSKKVVCVFNDKALAEASPYTHRDGILGFRSLRGEKNSVGQYDANYTGLQYYGKGGTKAWKIWKSNEKKIQENESTQRKMLLAMARQADDWAGDVLGMMYWTSTGSVTSIADRNKEMWGTTGVRRMHELWYEGLEASISTQMERDRIRALEFGGVRRVKAYFPNIIMIDFADAGKCESIIELNTVVDYRLAKAYDKYVSGKPNRSFF